MKREERIRIIQGIVLINISIFLLSSFFLTSRGSFSYETGNDMDYFFGMILAREDWGSCLIILLCTSICSFGIYRICIKPLKVHKEESKVSVEKKSKPSYWS